MNHAVSIGSFRCDEVVQNRNDTSGTDGLSISGVGTTLTNRGLNLRSLGGAEILGAATLTLDGSHAQGAMLDIDGTGTFLVDGTLNVEAGGIVTNTFGQIGVSSGWTGVATVTGAGSQWNNSDDLFVGNEGNGTLTVEARGIVTNTFGHIGFSSGSTGVATVTGTDSQWNNSGSLAVGNGGNGTLNVENNGLVTVGGTTSIGATGTVNLDGGRFEFGQTTLAEFSSINAVAGSMAGNLNHTGATDVVSLTALQNTNVDLTDVSLINSGLLFGSAFLGNALVNTASGELRTLSGQWARFQGVGNTNAGEINNFAGTVEFTRDLTNSSEINNFGGNVLIGQGITNTSTGFVGGRGVFAADGGWNNSGVMAFGAGATDIIGDVNNAADGRIITSGFAVTTFFDDVVHNGAEIRTAQGSGTVFLGAASGNGNYTGTGPVFFEGDLRPGTSPGDVSFGGDVLLGFFSATEIELAGEAQGIEYDVIRVAGNLTLGGTLDVVLLDGFQPSFGNQFAVLTFSSVSGDFRAYTGLELAGGLSLEPVFSDSALTLTVVPEPSTPTLAALGLLCLVGFSRRRRHQAT